MFQLSVKKIILEYTVCSTSRKFHEIKQTCKIKSGKLNDNSVWESAVLAIYTIVHRMNMQQPKCSDHYSNIYSVTGTSIG